MSEQGAVHDTDAMLAMLRQILACVDPMDAAVVPWEAPHHGPAPALDGRISATDQLNWWFRPAATGRDPWGGFFEAVDAPSGPTAPRELVTPNALMFEPATSAPTSRPPAETIGKWAGLQLLLAEPEEEMFDADAEAVVTCLYDFVHAIGRGDITAAMDCISPDYHAIENDREYGFADLAEQLKAMLDPLRGWLLTASVVEIPQPVLHPQCILVLAEIQLDARHPTTNDHREIVDRRIAVFRQSRDRRWRVAALSPI